MDASAARSSHRADAGEVTRLRAASRGDVHAFTEVMTARLPQTYRLACVMLGTPADAAAATQEAFVAAWRELSRLREPAEFGPWFDQVVLDVCRMRARGRAAAVKATDDEALARLVSARTALSLEEDAVLDLLDDRFDLLDPDDRAILALRCLDDWPVTDIGAVLHMSVGTVKWRLHEARQALASVLDAV